MESGDQLREHFAGRAVGVRGACAPRGANRESGAAKVCVGAALEGDCLSASPREGGCDGQNQAQEESCKRRFKCVVAYDGTDFCGWQSQITKNSVQDFIEHRLKAIFGFPVRISGSGRTDAGVHARGQVFHFDAVWKHSCQALLRAMRTNVQSVRVLSLQEVPASFHARFSAKGKRYIYRICKDYPMPDLARYRWSLGGRNVDVEAMAAASRLFLGTHDFKSFSANRGAGARENTVKTLTRLDVCDSPEEITIITEGSGYLYKMVRMIVGALVQRGLGKISDSDIQKALENPHRGNIFQAAPAAGLTLDEVFY